MCRMRQSNMFVFLITFCIAHFEKVVGEEPGAGPSYEEMEAAFHSELKLNPNNAQVWHRLAWLMHRRGAIAEAEAALRASLLLEPKKAPTHESLANLLLERKAFAEAEASYRLVLQVVPTRAETHSKLGQLLLEEGRDMEAEVAYRVATLGNSQNSLDWQYLGLILEKRGLVAESISCFQQVVRLAPHAASPWSRLGELHVTKARRSVDIELSKSGAHLEAEASLRHAVTLTPSHAPSHHVLSEALLDMNRVDEAETCLATAMQLQPESIYFQRSSARILSKRGSSQQSESLLRSIVQSGGSDRDVIIDIARITEERKAYEEAEYFYQAALLVEPNSGHIQKQLSKILSQQGRHDEARLGWQIAFKMFVQAGQPALNFIARFPGDERAYQHALANEHEMFVSIHQNPPSWATEPMAELPHALQAIRKLESDENWLIDYMVERQRICPQCGYSRSILQQWRDILQRPAVSTVLSSWPGKRTFLSLGSGLAEDCIFALASGFSRCVLFDLLCDSMVSQVRRVAEDHGYASMIEYHCANAQHANQSFGEATLVRSSFAYGNKTLRTELHAKLARELPEGALVLSMVEPMAPGLRIIDIVTETADETKLYGDETKILQKTSSTA